MTQRINNKPTLLRTLALLSLILPAIVNAGSGLPEPSQVSQHAGAWIGPYGPPTGENQGFRMNMGFVVGNDRVDVINVALRAVDRAAECSGLSANIADLQRFVVLRGAGRSSEANAAMAERNVRAGAYAESAAEAQRAVSKSVEELRAKRQQQTGGASASAMNAMGFRKPSF